MARIRSIHPNACDSRKLADSTADAERLFWRLLTHCDDHGRCEDDPRLIWAHCGPLIAGWSPEAVDGLLSDLAASGLIVRYRADGREVIEVGQWSEYQHPNRPKASTLPAPPRVTNSSMSGHEQSSAGGEWSGEGERPAHDVNDSEPVDNLAAVRNLRGAS